MDRGPCCRAQTRLDGLPHCDVLERMEAARVVPGFGSWTGGRMIARQRHFLEELRRQIAFVISQGHAPSAMKREIRLPGDAFVWMPYDTPTAEDLDHVYHELTVPAAPFDGRPPSFGDSRPHALVLYADQPHEPAAIVEGLTPVFEATGVVPHFTVDVRALTAKNLSKVELLVDSARRLDAADRGSIQPLRVDDRCPAGGG